jgi:hypothetical protein
MHKIAIAKMKKIQKCLINVLVIINKAVCPTPESGANFKL